MDAERFWAKVDIRGPEECWPWLASLKPAGYGQLRIGGRKGKTLYAHRVAWELTHGPIPPGKHIDHVAARGCTMRRCCNPAHMEPVDQRENIVRGRGWAGRNAAKTHCPKGHPYDEENTVIYGCRRICRTCKREHDRKVSRARYWAKKRALKS